MKNLTNIVRRGSETCESPEQRKKKPVCAVTGSFYGSFLHCLISGAQLIIFKSGIINLMLKYVINREGGGAAYKNG